MRGALALLALLAAAAGAAGAVPADPPPAAAAPGAGPAAPDGGSVLAGPGHAAPPGSLESRPPAGQASPLQDRIDAAAPGSMVTIEGGSWRGDLFIDRPLRLIGHGRPRLIGSGTGSVVRIRADGVTLEGFDIDGLGGGDLGRDSSGVHVAAAGVVVRDCRVSGTLFGVYLRAAPGAVVQRCVIRGIPGLTPGQKGSGIHVWNTDGFTLDGNDITQVRDGLYIQSSTHGRITGNVARDLRYGLHYMYSDDIVFEDNTFENGDAGTAIMYSRRITFRRNRFLRNRGFASVGLLLKNCDDVTAEDNLIADNARGVFLEGSNNTIVRRNLIAESDAAIVLYDSCAGTRVTGNSFVGNLSPLFLVGRRTDTVFEGNYWSGNDEPDLDGDGVSDRAYRLTNVFDHLRGNLTAADLMAQGAAAAALAAAEQSFPVLQQVSAIDPRPLARPPLLADVPRRDTRRTGGARAGLIGSALLCAAGAAALARGGRRPAPARGPAAEPRS
jgi:nitrous oxidase accessory protein